MSISPTRQRSGTSTSLHMYRIFEFCNEQQRQNDTIETHSRWRPGHVAYCTCPRSSILLSNGVWRSGRHVDTRKKLQE